MPGKAGNPIFSEVQRFSEGFLVGVVAFILLINAYVLTETPAEAQGTIFLTGFFIIAVLVGIYYFMVLRTDVDDAGIRVSLSGLGRKAVAFTEIDAVSRYDYRPIREFGGWGIRLSSKGTMYNARGTIAVKLQLKSGDVLFIGTQRPDDLLAAITPHLAAA